MNEDLKWLAENVHEWLEDHDSCDVEIESWGKVAAFRYGPAGKHTRAQWQAARDELSGKPSWDDAPDMAQWLCQDPDGWWLWFRYKPVAMENEWPGGESTTDGFIECGLEGVLLGDWRNTLERRPECTKTTEKSTEGECMSNERTWRGPKDGLPPVGIRVELHNDQGYYLDYMQSAIGEEVTVKAVFYSGDSNIPMVAVETDDKTCGCFRVAMLKPCKTEEDKAVEEMMESGAIAAFFEENEGHANDAAFKALFRSLLNDGYRKQEVE